MSKIKVSFSVDEINAPISLKDINETQFTKVRIKAFSTGITKHNYVFNEQVLKESAFSLLGKPILYKYDIWNDDASAHEEDEIQCGFIPKDENDAELSFETDEHSGKIFLYVNAYIWSVYQEKLVRILERDDGVKSVSVEMWLIDKEEHDTYTTVNKFLFNGVTILGDHISPACEGANMEVLKFSTENYEKAQSAFEKELYKSIDQESLEDSFLIQKNKIKEGFMAKTLENAVAKTPEVLENGEVRKTVDVSVSEYASEYDDDGNFVSSTSEYHSKSKTTVEDTDSENGTNNLDSVNNSEVSENDNNRTLELKCSELESSLKKLQEKHTALLLKCSNLEDYKKNKEDEEKVLSIECAINDVSNVLSPDEIEDWRKRSLNCANIDGFKNELKAFAFDKQQRSGSAPKEVLRNSISVAEKELSTNIWEQLEKIV